MKKQFLPMSRAEMTRRGWSELDILIISGDAYVDHPSFGAAVIGRVLEADGWRVGIIAQPDWKDDKSLTVMGTPRLFAGITAGNLDSMLAQYTAGRRKRREDAYSEDGKIGMRPNLATIVYAQLAQKTFPGLPVVLGGIEASLRRLTHYDYWQDKLRPSILLNAKADMLVYGMGEKAVREIARRLAEKESLEGISGTARLLGKKEAEVSDFSGSVLLPSFEECAAKKEVFIDLMRIVEREQNPFSGKQVVQFYAERAVVCEPPAEPLYGKDLDRIYDLPFVRRPHSSYKKDIPAFRMIKDSITVMRGCCGGCSFCGLGMHQGRFLSSRSAESVEKEVRALTEDPSFRGTVSDLGGPTANLYGCRNGVHNDCKTCKRASCLYPAICSHLEIEAESALRLMQCVRSLEKVKHVFIQSGIRMDVALKNPRYIRELARHHVSGHLKVAPEHLHQTVLKRMRKSDPESFHRFMEVFENESKKAGKKQYLVPYFISNFPGSTEAEMKIVEDFLRKEKWNLQQVQDFIPLPMTPAAAMYYTGLDYETKKPIIVVRGLKERRTQMRQLRPGEKRTRNKYARRPSKRKKTSHE